MSDWGTGYNTALAAMRTSHKATVYGRGGKPRSIAEVPLPDQSRSKHFQDGYCICVYLYRARMRMQ